VQDLEAQHRRPAEILVVEHRIAGRHRRARRGNVTGELIHPAAFRVRRLPRRRPEHRDQGHTHGVDPRFRPGAARRGMALLLIRAVVMQHRKPEWVDRAWLGRPRQVVEVAVILGTIDAAIWAGWWAWRRRGAPSAEHWGPTDLASAPGTADELSGGRGLSSRLVC